jgi:hypothetical protein
MDLLTTLTTLANGMTVVREAPRQVLPGQDVGAAIVPSTLGLTVPTLAAGDLNLFWLTKNDRFADDAVVSPPLEDVSILGGMPIPNLSGTTGVPGLIGQLAGRIPIPVQVPVSVQVQWSVTDELDQPLTEGIDYAAPDGLSGPVVNVFFAAAFVELSLDALPTLVTRRIHASVELSAEGVSTGPIPLPPVSVDVPPVPIPTVAAFFAGTDANGSIFVMTPPNSPLRDLNQLSSTLTTLQSSIGSLQTIVDLAAFLLGLQQLNAALAAARFVQFRCTQSVSDLEGIVWQTGSTFGTDYDADDAFRSLILLAASDASRHTVEVYNDSGFDRDEGMFRVAVGADMIAIVRDFDGKTPTSSPASSQLEVVKKPPGGVFDPDHFSGEASSIRFV